MTTQTSLGMPAMPPPTSAPTWKTAWDQALYGDNGFFRRETPSAHFRTSVHASPLFAEALLRMLRAERLDTVVDIGAGGGELLMSLHALDPSLELLGVEVAPRPSHLPPRIAWSSALPELVEGMVVANEWLDNIPCHVVQVDTRGVPRVVHVDPVTGQETLGAAYTDAAVPRPLQEWCQRWWPLDGAPPGARAEVGTTRDTAWADVVRRVRRGVALSVDYGHTREGRPPFGTLTSYQRGREVDLLPDGSRDVTAHVAVDAVAAAVEGTVVTQRRALRDLGISGTRPALDLAGTEPARYVRALATATEAAELTAEHGLGAHHWVIARRTDQA